MAYYTRCFPTHAVCRLFGRAWDQASLGRREFALEGQGFFRRFNYVASAEDLRFLIREAAALHIGAVYTCDMRNKQLRGLSVQRELVVEIDLNDYAAWGVDANDIGACDSAFHLCAFGMICMKYLLSESFGFRHFLICYSGRRGAHLTVHDRRACALSDEARGSLVSFLTAAGTSPAAFAGIVAAPFFDEMWKTHVKPYMTFCVKAADEGGAGLFDSVLDRNDFVASLDHDALAAASLDADSGPQLWHALLAAADETSLPRLQQAVAARVWPQIDAAVTKRKDHLSKAPFSKHGKTGRIALPILGDLSRFKPSDCPTAEQLLRGEPVALEAMEAAVSAVEKLVDRLEQEETLLPSPCLQPTASPASICFHIFRTFWASPSSHDGASLSFSSAPVASVAESVENVGRGYGPTAWPSSRFSLSRTCAALKQTAYTLKPQEVGRVHVVCWIKRRCSRAEAETRLEELVHGLSAPVHLLHLPARTPDADLARRVGRVKNVWKLRALNL